MTTLRDALESAFESAEEGTLEPVNEVQIDESEPVSRVRDEAGRFAKVEKPEEASIEKVETPAIEPQAPITRKPPTSWKKDYWERWEKLDPDLQTYLEEREGQYATGVSQYKQQYEQVRPLYQAIQPFMPELQQHQIDPAQWISNLGNAHKVLALGTPEQKVQMFARLATEYGVPLESLNGQPINSQFGLISNELAIVRNELNSFKTTQQRAEEARLIQEIEAFKANAPHFEAVRGPMSQLLQSGMAPDLQTAYDMAVRLDANLFNQSQASQAASVEAKRQSDLAKKKAAAVSPKSASPTGSIATGGNTKKSLRDTLSEQFDAVTAGRF